jgi:hypothetical protein
MLTVCTRGSLRAGGIRMANKRLNDWMQEIRLAKLLGSGNHCPKCGMIGLFGSIRRIDGDNCQYLVCGWCYKISKVKEE